MKKIGGIYSILNIENGLIYIGSSDDFARRWSHHKWMLNGDYHHSDRLQADWKIFGSGKFIFTQIEIVEDPNQLTIREDYWIKFYDSANPKKGYNVESDAVRHTHSEETRQKISKSNKALNRKYIPTPETIKRLSESHKGQIAWNEGKKLPRVKRNCLECGNEFELSYRTDPKVFCGAACRGKNRRKLVDLVCPVCKGTFQRKPSEIDTFCSRECYYTTLKGNKYAIK
jgi:group I intron endonuclease